MMNRIFRLLLINTLILITISVFGQKTATKAADEAFENNKYTLAIEKYKKAYSKVKSDKIEKTRIIYQLAECYRMTNNIKRAKMQYKRLLREDFQQKKPEILLHYADALRADEEYEDALEQYKAYNELIPEDPRGSNGIESCKVAIEWYDNPTDHEVELVKKLSSRESDFTPAYASDNYNSVIFTSTREGSTGKATDEWTDENFSDLYISRIDRKGEWSTPVLLDNTEGEVPEEDQESTFINTSANEGTPNMNSTYSVMYFTRCPNENQSISGCQIYKSKYSGRSWSQPELILLGNDTNAVIGHPSISQDELSIYFSSERAGGFGGKDLWVATRESASEDFGRPMNLGPRINTPGDEMFPYLRNDSTLYFASNGHVGLGGLDIFETTINEEDEWGEPENMQYPINTNHDDFGIVFHPGLEKGFFSSNRKRGRDDDIYSFVIPPVEFTLAGTVKNERTLQFVEGATVELIGSDGTSISTRTNDKGYFIFGKTQIIPNTTYEIIISRDNYFTTKGTETTVGLEKSEDLSRNFLLEPIPEEPIVLPDILYEFNKYALLPQYQDSLQGLIETLDNNETIVIELASHTDSRSTYEYNDVLSQKRAQSVVNYLIDRGIDPDRLVAKGYGERVPRDLKKDIMRDGFKFTKGAVLTESYIDSLSTEEHREAAHQLNRRTEFRVLRKDFVPKTKTEITELAEINIVTNPEVNEVPYTTNPNTGNIEAVCMLNGYSMQFTFERNLKPTISLKKALELLNKGAITKNDFNGDPSKVLARGTIANGASFNINELGIGNLTVKNIKLTVNHRLQVPLTLNTEILRKFGKFEINKKKKAIVFEEKSGNN